MAIRRITQAPIKAGGRLEAVHIRDPAKTPTGGTVAGARVSRNTTEGWLAKKTYIPDKNEIVVYTDHAIVGGVYVPGIKLGDGNAYVVDLPFVGADLAAALQEHIANEDVHVSEQDREFWDSKLNYDIDGEELIFTRL